METQPKFHDMRDSGLPDHLHDDAHEYFDISERTMVKSYRLERYLQQLNELQAECYKQTCDLVGIWSDLKSQILSATYCVKQKSFIFHGLVTFANLFVRTDSVRTALQQPYEGPYPVMECYAKYFDISIRRVSRTISIDRLKSCFFSEPDPS
ncbi:hypothetical protein TNCV_463801 [Trichonephila clavipes]|nr:hypothetical protein TNCV_463801 [Trichonephila clavipes]